jgi:hypothetical protein
MSPVQQVQCSCGSRFTAQPHLAGKTVPCPACGAPLHVPALRQVPVGLTPIGSRISVVCACGQGFAAEPHLAGQYVACSRCGQPLFVPSCGQPAYAPSPVVGGVQAVPVGPVAPSDSYHGARGGGLTLPIKIVMGLGGAAVAVLLLAIVVRSFRSSGEDTSVARPEPMPGQGTGASVAPTAAAKPAPAKPPAPSTLAKAADFLSAGLKGRPKVYATPQEVFAAFWKAERDEDLRTLLGTMSPDLREQTVAATIGQVALMRTAKPELAEGLQKYGVDFAQVPPMLDESRLRELAAQVNDPAGFIEAANRRLLDAGRAQAKDLLEQARTAPQRPDQPGRPPRPRPPLTDEQRAQIRKMYEKDQEQRKTPPQLRDLVITGDTATGTAVREGDLFKFSARMHFVKIGESWYVARSQL